MRLTYNAQKFMVTVAAIAMFCAGTAMAETLFIKNSDKYVTQSDDDIYQMNAALEPVTKACSEVGALDVKNGSVTAENGDIDGAYKYGDVIKYVCVNTGTDAYNFKVSSVQEDLTKAKAKRVVAWDAGKFEGTAKKFYVLNEDMKTERVDEDCPSPKVAGDETGVNKDKTKCYEKVELYDVTVACRENRKPGDGTSPVYRDDLVNTKYDGVKASKDRCYRYSGGKFYSALNGGYSPSNDGSEAYCRDGYKVKSSGTYHTGEKDSVTAASNRLYCVKSANKSFYRDPSERPYVEKYKASVTRYEGCSYTNVNGAKSDKIVAMDESIIAMQNGKKACFLEPNTEANGNHTLKITGSSTAASVKVNAPVNVRLENTTIKGNQAPALDLDGNYNHTVYFSGTNTLTGADGKAAVRKASNSGYMLTIVGDATDAMLKANGGSGAAGIGGNEGEAASKIVIREGVVTAVAGDNATYGIGPGANANDDGGAVVIAGGSIKATNAGGGDAINAVDEQNEPVHLLKFGTEDVKKLYIQSSKKDEYGKEGDIQAAEKYAAKFFPTRHGDEDNVYLYLGEKEEHDLMVNPNVSEDGKTVTSSGKTSRVKWDAYKSMFVYNLAFLDSYLHDVLVYNGHEQSVVVDSAKIWMLNKLVKLEPGKNFALDNEKLTNANVTCKEAYVERNVDINATAGATTPVAKYCDAEKYVENADSLYKVEPVNNDERFYGYVQHKKTMLPYVLDNMDFVNAEKQFDAMGFANTNDPVKQKGGADSLVYNGAEQTQWIDSVVLNNVLHYPNSQFANYKLDTGTDYEVSDNKQTDIGTYTLTISAKGSNFVGKATRRFAIKNLNVDGEGCYVIASSVELYTFADVVTNARSGKICAKLTDNITVNDNVLDTDGALNGDGSKLKQWTPMIVYSNVKVALDGNGHTISGLYFNEERNGVGLFGLVKDSLSISNLGIEDSYFKGFARVGGLVGHIEKATLSITNSYNAGSVSGTGDNVGGLVGYADGENVTLSITNSYNAGSVSGGENSWYVGGLVGYASRESKLSITNSYNAGSVSGGENSRYVGGLVGDADGENVTLSITNSYNAGSVSGAEGVGGLVGVAYGELSITNSFFLATGEYNVYYGGTETSLDDFHDGTVARALHDWCEKEEGSETCKVGGKNGSVWGQDLTKENSLPDLSGKITGTLYDLVLHTFDDDNRSYPTYYLSEKGLELPTGLTRENYVFLGWSAKETAASDADFVTSIAKGETGKKEFYAQWMKLNADGCYEIASGIALYKFAEIVNDATNGSQVCGTLVDNIVVNTDVLDENGALNGGGSSFTPWNPMTVVRGVQVTLDGAGKTISGLYFNDENQYNVGLFGDVRGELSISNLGIKDSYFKGGYYVGGLVGYAYGNNVTLSITNSYNAGSVSGGENSRYAGGLVGYAYGTLSIMNSYNAGAVSGAEGVGGLVGYAYGELTITNSFFLATGNDGDKLGGTETSLDDFHNGTVARALHDWCEKEEGSETCKVGGKNGSVWGQDLTKENSLPDLSGKITGTLYDLVLHTFDDDNRSYPTYYLSEKGLELPMDLTRKNYVFLGWSAKETAASDADFVTSIAKGETGKKEFYAQWMKLNADGCYEIASGIALYKFAEIVNNATNGSQVCGTLVDNIVVNTDVLDENGALNGGGSSFTPWNPMTVVRGVQVTLDGAGKTISGLYFNDENQYNVGLFGCVLKGKLFISNLGIVDSYFRGKYYVGSFVGLNSEGDEVLIANSYNAGTVSGNDFSVGGLVGGNGVGMGFVGMTITNSYNVGSVSGGENSEYVGGLVGDAYDAELSITNSYNAGSVSGGDDSYEVGGLVGYAYDAELSITNSYNAGAVRGAGDVGGLVGYADGENVTLSITSSYNAGSVSGTGNYVGGLVGFASRESKLSITNSFFLGEGDNYGGFGKTTTEFHDGTVVSRLHYYSANGVDGSIWGQDLNDANSLPDFSGKIVGGGASYKLTLYTFEGKTLDYPKEYIEQLGLELPTNVTREGYIFLGWSTKEKAASDADFVTSIAKGETGKKEFYAQWMKLNGDGCFEIASTMELYGFANFVTNASSGKICGKLTNDITVNGEVLDKDGALNGDGSKLKQWTPMNVNSGVKVTFDGNGHTISGLYFNEESVNDVGLFGFVSDSLAISNLGVVDSYFKGKNYVGGLVGRNDGTLTITNSYNAGSVSGGENSWHVGGLVGRIEKATLSITNSYNAGAVSGGENSDFVGGLVGNDFGELTITNSFFLATGEYNVYYGGTETSMDDFHNGTVARALHDWCEKEEGSETCKVGGKNGSVWGQDLNDANSLPDFSGEIGHKYGSVVFFYGEDDQVDSAHVDATSELTVDFPNDVVVSGPVKFKRTFAGNGFSTIMLPFTPDFTDAADTIEGVNFYEFTSFTDGAVGVKPVSQWNGSESRAGLAANTPYLVSAAGATELVFKNGGTFNTTTGDAYKSKTGEYKVNLGGEGNVNGWTIYGTYDYKTWEEGDAGLGRTYGFAANDGVNNPLIVGKFTKVGAGAHIYPMRAYLEYEIPVKKVRTAPNSARAANTVASLPETINVMIVDKDETSGEQTTRVIGTINTRTGEFKFATDRWFDLNGRYLGEKKPTQKGVYYNNGKKVIVK